jgi:hypothetical protein
MIGERRWAGSAAQVFDADGSGGRGMSAVTPPLRFLRRASNAPDTKKGWQR